MRALTSSTESFRDWICPETWSIFALCASCWVCTCFCRVSTRNGHFIDGVGALLDEVFDDAHALVIGLLQPGDCVLQLLDLGLELHHVFVGGEGWRRGKNGCEAKQSCGQAG